MNLLKKLITIILVITITPLLLVLLFSCIFFVLFTVCDQDYNPSVGLCMFFYFVFMFITTVLVGMYHEQH